mmetsp:Transcript_49789/g.93180  ORF Transcript_49789/g.93180 Transcript_49789/m.93180 type:complete len:104 (+) Transcript_49789:523-834(+)
MEITSQRAPPGILNRRHLNMLSVCKSCLRCRKFRVPAQMEAVGSVATVQVRSDAHEELGVTVPMLSLLISATNELIPDTDAPSFGRPYPVGTTESEQSAELPK